MFGLAFRIFWRIFILLLAVYLAYQTIFIIYPYIDDKLPAMVALIIIYALVAYLAIPLLVRLWRIVIKPNHLPVYVISGDGWPSDPVNIALICRSEAELRSSMQKAGWTAADKVTPITLVKMLYAMVLNRSYPNAPFSSLYLFNRRQDIGFQIQEGDPPTPRHRHHVRFWRLHEPSKRYSSKHHGFWRDLMHKFFQYERQVWVGSATHDIAPVALRIRNFQLTHQIDENTNKERDFLIDTLKKAGRVKGTEEITSGHNLKFRGQTFGVNIVVDGRLKIVRLK